MSSKVSIQVYCDRLRASDREAFSALFRSMREKLLHYIHSLIHDDRAAHDLTQEVFLTLWELRESIDAHKSLRAYLYKLARMRVVEHVRNAGIAIRTEDQGTDVDWPVSKTGKDTLSDQMKAWINALPVLQREALLLSRYHGLSHREIADVLTVSPREATNHLAGAVNALLRQIEIVEPALLES